LDRDENPSIVQPELVMNEFIGMLGFDVKSTETFRREVFQIEGDNYICFAMYGGCKNVAVITIGQLQGGLKSFKIMNETVRHGLGHELLGAIELLAFKVASVQE
jgi:hypothetical protein